MPTATLRFLGAARNVTGSRFLLEYGDTRLLVDCGLYQERELQDRNWQPFPAPPASIDAVLITHAHLDHSGYLPKLVREGFRGRIYCTGPTADIMRILLEDTAHIQEEDAAYKKRRHEREGRRGRYPEVPLYTTSEALAAQDQISTVRYETPLRLKEGIQATFRDAGHILGSATIEVAFGEGEARRAIVFTGDLGREDKPILHDPKTYTKADYAVVDSTYGDRQHPDMGNLEDALTRVVNETVAAGGNVIIPSFAVERAQELLYMFKRLQATGRIPHLLTFLDSPMATDVTGIFERHPDLLDPELAAVLRKADSPFTFPGLTIVRSVEHSKTINSIKGTVVIIAGAGMCTGGRIKHHLANNIERPNATILFVGYQAHGTLGREIVDGKSPVRIHGVFHEVRARVAQLQGFSAHADRDGVTAWLDALREKPRRVFVVHGEEQATFALADHLRSKGYADVLAPEYNAVVTLD